MTVVSSHSHNCNLSISFFRVSYMSGNSGVMHCLRVVRGLWFVVYGVEGSSDSLFDICSKFPVDHAFKHLGGR